MSNVDEVPLRLNNPMVGSSFVICSNEAKVREFTPYKNDAEWVKSSGGAQNKKKAGVASLSYSG